MNRARVAEVQKLCGEVAALCKAWDKLEAANEKTRQTRKEGDVWIYYKPTGRASAALKRRSMDLTNALADMRKP